MSNIKPLTPKQERKLRAALIARLGWAAEPSIAAERYCAGTGELAQTVTEKFGRDAADACVRLARAS